MPGTRRTRLVLFGAALGGLLAGARAGEAPPEGRRPPQAPGGPPAAAWQVPIGACERGVPLGGFGAGSFMLNACGAFGPWHFIPGLPEEGRRLAGAAFHFYEKPEGGAARVATLAARPPMPGWASLPPGSGSYAALYPKGWFAYRGFAADLAMKFFSPIVRNNVRETSYPVAIFEFTVANPTARKLDVALMFTFPNAAAHSAELRTGFVATAETDPEHKLAAVVLDARDERNPPTAQDAEWCIAVRAEGGGEVSHAASWNALASGGDVLGEFAATGRLPDKPLDATASAAAVAFRATLDPKASITVPFALSWDFPRVAFPISDSGFRISDSMPSASLGPGPQSAIRNPQSVHWWRRYTEYFGQKGDAAFKIAREALLRHAEWEAAVDAWVRPVLDEPAYPAWLKQAAFNELYYESFGGAFWEAGCITAPEEFKKLHPEDHKHFLLGSPSQLFCEPLALRFAAQRARLALWPQIERDTLLAYADLIDATGPFAHDLGTPSGSPFFEGNAAISDFGFRISDFNQKSEIRNQKSPSSLDAPKDLPALFVLQAYACWQATGDKEFLAYVWSACKKCYAALRAADAYGYGLPGHSGDDTATSPCPLHGVSLLGGGLCVAALEALERLADAAADKDAEAIRRLVPLARANLDRQLWRPSLGYYALDTRSRHSDALAAGALSGVRFAQAAGLPQILPADRLQRHLHQAFLRCVKPLRDSTGDRVGDMGALSVVGPDHTPPPIGRAAEVSVADSYRLAAAMYRVGRERQDKELVAAALQTAFGVYYQTWAVEPDKPLWAFETPRGWHAAAPARAHATQHIEARAVWDLLLEIKDPYAAAPEGPPKE
ncbi:MAG: hypothetical protein FJ291_19780 [Planctomycetes bacterium]|nr:hypothetical protein [Planctomycetota bacterium]